MSHVIVLSSDEDEGAMSLPSKEIEKDLSVIKEHGIVLSSDEDEGAMSLPSQEIEKDLSVLKEHGMGSFHRLSPREEEIPSTSQINEQGTMKKARVFHELSINSDDNDVESPLCNQMKFIHSSDDELPDIDINLEAIETYIGRHVTVEKKANANGKFCKSLESNERKYQKREEQRVQKEIGIAEKARQRQAKQQEKEQKKKEAVHAKALKQVAAEVEKSKKQGECLKWITAILDAGLLNTDYSGELLTSLRSSEVDCKVEECIVPCSVSWERRLQNVNVDDDMVIHRTTTIQNEPWIIVVWMWNTLIQKIYENTLQTTIEDMVALLPNKNLTIAVFGLEDYFKYQKTKKRRDVRSEVLGKAPQKRKGKEGDVETAPVLSRGDVEFALAEIQITSNVSHRIINCKADLANLVCQFTKAIAEAPFKREKLEKEERLDWYASGDSKDCVAVDKDGNGLSQLWHRQLCQFPLASRETSEAIASVYPSPVSLLQAYEMCSSEKDAQYLLEDVSVRRGPGPLSSTRRIGPQLSKKIHTFFTTFDESALIAPD